MGRLRNLARRVRDSIKDIAQEASHPGTSPPHRAGREDRFEPPAQPKVRTDSASATKATSDIPWYLQGDEETDGWENTDAMPDEEKPDGEG